jgi:MFS transporter, putative metabolite transport protein
MVVRYPAPQPRDSRAKKFIALATAGAFLDGYDIVIVSAAILLIKPAFHLDANMTGLVTAATFIGMVAGAFVFGSIADKVGRRKVFIADMILFIVAALVAGLAPNLGVLITGRILTGVAIGMDYPAATSVVMELSGKRRRGGFGMIMQTAGFAGDLLAVIVGLLLYSYGGAAAWRWMFLSAIIPAAVVFLLRSGTPESPFWIASTARSGGDAAPVAMRLGRYRDVLRPPYGKRTLFVATFWFLGNITGASLLLYTPTLALTGFGLQGSRSLWFSAALDAVYMAANVLIAVYLIDRYGRRALTLVAWLSALVFTLILVGTLGGNIWPSLVLFALATVFVQAGIMGPAFPWSAELFPTRLRATGQGFATAGGKLGGLLGTLFLPTILASWGLRGVFIGVAVAFVLGALLTFAIGTETSQTTLEERDREDPAVNPGMAKIVASVPAQGD